MPHLPMTKLISSLSKRSHALPVPELLVGFIHFDHSVTPKEDERSTTMKQRTVATVATVAPVALPWHTLCPGRAVPDVCAQHAKATPKT